MYSTGNPIQQKGHIIEYRQELLASFDEANNVISAIPGFTYAPVEIKAFQFNNTDEINSPLVLRIISIVDHNLHYLIEFEYERPNCTIRMNNYLYDNGIDFKHDLELMLDPFIDDKRMPALPLFGLPIKRETENMGNEYKRGKQKQGALKSLRKLFILHSLALDEEDKDFRFIDAASRLHPVQQELLLEMVTHLSKEIEL